MGILLSWSNLAEAEAVNLSVDSEAPGLGLRAVLTPQIAEVWRSNAWGATAINLRVDLGEARSIGAIAVASPRDGLLPGAASTLRVTADPSVVDGAAAFDSITLGNHNLLLNSQNFQTGWTLQSVTLSPGVATSPDGTMNATGVADTTGAALHNLFQFYTAAPATTYTISVYAKAGEATSVTLRAVFAGLTNNSTVAFSLLTGVATTVAAGMVIAAVSQDLGNGWWRCSVTITTPEVLSSTSLTVRIQAGTASYVGTGNIQFYIWGGSLSRSSTALTYIATASVPMSDRQMLGLSMARFGLWGWGGAAIQARYLRLCFTGGVGDAYLQLGRLWIGPALITARAASFGFSAGAADPGGNVRAALTGVRDVQRGRAYRTPTFSIDTMTEAEASEVELASVSAGTTGQVLAARLHSDIAGTGCFGVFSRPPAVSRASFPAWRAEFAIEEDL